MDTFEVGTEHIAERNEILEALTEEQADALAAKHLDLDEMIVIVVGDKATQMEKLRTLGLPIIEVDADGTPVQ